MVNSCHVIGLYYVIGLRVQCTAIKRGVNVKSCLTIKLSGM